jgi:multidrug resistance protein MdtO
MVAQAKVLPNSIDETGKWVWSFLKNELTPYPGRAWVVARVTIAATLVMVLVMTFQIPNGFLGAIFTLFLSREIPRPPSLPACGRLRLSWWPPPTL